MVECRMSETVQDALASESGSGMALPLLPTLVVAVIVAAASFLCSEPARVSSEAPAIAAAVAESPAAQPASVDAAANFVPAALAFRQFPFVVEARSEAPQRRAAPRVAARTTIRRPDIARADAIHAAPAIMKAGPAAPPPVETASEDAPLPAIALPFAPAISALGRAGSFIGAQGTVAGARAVALGDAVVGLVGGLR